MSNNSFKVKNGLTLTPVDLTTLTTPQAGDLACDINDNNKIKRYDAASASWVEVGSGGVGSLDILFAQDFESASLSSFTQTGLALDTVDPLHGKVSAKLTHQAGVSPTNDQSFKQIVTVDRKFRGQAIIMRLNVKSGASAGNVTISVYDETNAASLLSSTQLQLSNEIDGISNAVSFTIPSTSSSISYTITALPEAGSPVTFIDDIVAELSNVALLETSVEVPVITEWVDAGPIQFSATTTAPVKGSTTSDSVRWRQVGEDYEVEYTYRQSAGGTNSTGDVLFILPSGITFDSSIPYFTGAITNVTSNSANPSLLDPVGNITLSTTDTGYGSAIAYSANSFRVQWDDLYTQRSPFGGTFYPFSSVLSFKLNLKFKGSGLTATTTKTIPLTQSGLVQEADSNFKGRGFVGQGTTNTGIVRLSSDVSSFGDAIIYSPSATLGDSWTVTKSGIYGVFGSVDTSNTTAGIQYFLSRNSSILTPISTSSFSLQNLIGSVGYANPNNDVTQFGGTTYLEAGDIIRLQCNTATATSSNGAYDFITITHQGSLKQVSVSSDQKITIPTSELRFEGASARGSTDTGIVQFTSMSKLRGDAFTVESDAVLGTRITMKKAGKLAVSVSMLVNSAGSVFGISLNQSVRTSSPTLSSEILSNQQIATSGGNESTSWQGEVQAGDIIRVYSTLVPTAAISNNLNLSFQEQDIAVSVTNTLPQFSESDSSVRVDTAAGYGSTGTCIRRFSAVRNNIGQDIEYIPNAVDGDSFVVKSDGIYHISYTDSQAGSSSAGMGITLNESATSTNIDTLIAQINNNVLSYGRRYDASLVTNLLVGQASWSGYLQAGDVIRAHTMGLGASDADACKFSISKVGKPNVTGVDVTPFVNIPQSDNQNSFLSSSTAFGNVDITGALTSSVGSGIYSYNPTTGVYTFLKPATVNISACLVASSVTPALSQIQYNGNQVALASTTTGGAGWGGTSSWTGKVNTGDTLKVRNSANGVTSLTYVSVSAEALSDQILTAPETFSTDTASLTYAPSSSYTLSTLQNAPVGTYITFTYAANTNTRTQTTTRPTQTDADMNANGIQIFARAFNAASTAGNPSAIAIQIGKGLKGKSLDLYKSAGKATAGSLDVYNPGSIANRTGIEIKEYSETTGILIIDAGYSQSSAITNHAFVFSDLTNQSSGYLVINASKNPALTGLGLGTVAARGINTSAQSIPNTGETIMLYDSIKTYDTHGALNTSTGTFTAPESGYYQASWSCLFSMTANLGQVVSTSLYKNGVAFSLGAYNTMDRAVAIDAGSNGSCGVYLAKGDTLDIRILNNRAGGATALNTTARSNFFSIHKTSVGTGN
jgi:hypothetical protein